MNQKFPKGEIKSIKGRSFTIKGDDIDTDRIIPARFLKCVSFSALGEQVFADDRKELKGNHPFDLDHNKGANILIVNDNFGCGSSREHAPQALMRWGIRLIIGESFAEIFFGNCLALGIPCLTASKEEIVNLQNLVEKNNNQITLTFSQNNKINCDHLIISDGVFSKSKSLISNDQIKPVYDNSIAIRGNISSSNISNINKNNISLFMGHDFHYVIYPLSNNDEAFNFIGILKYKLTANKLDNYNLFKEETFTQSIKDKLQGKTSATILDNLTNIKYFPVFVSKSYLKPVDNIFLVGDAFFAFPPSFAQGASQSI